MQFKRENFSIQVYLTFNMCIIQIYFLKWNLQYVKKQQPLNFVFYENMYALCSVAVKFISLQGRKVFKAKSFRHFSKQKSILELVSSAI